MKEVIKKNNIAVLVSGSGTNLQAIIDAEKNGIIKNGQLRLVISNNKEAYALQRGRNEDIESLYIPSKEPNSSKEPNNSQEDTFERKLKEALVSRNISLVVLAGFTKILSAAFVENCQIPIINIHPSLIPSFCGKGYYGLKVHQAALERGVKLTGATVHFVNEIPDGGQIIMQKAVEVLPDDTPRSLQKRVMAEAEWIILPQAIERICYEQVQNQPTENKDL